MRASHVQSPGTWGFGLWNDPFSMNLFASKGGLRMPTLPQATWFFFANAECYLSLRDDLPANGAMAATFSSRPLDLLSLLKLALVSLSLPWRAGGSQMRRLLRNIVQQEAARISIDPREWHMYQISWEAQRVRFAIDGEIVLQTHIAPRPPQGLVIWIDNQFAAWYPDGRVRYGFLPHPQAAWVEFGDLQVESTAQP